VKHGEDRKMKCAEEGRDCGERIGTKEGGDCSERKGTEEDGDCSEKKVTERDQDCRGKRVTGRNQDSEKKEIEGKNHGEKQETKGEEDGDAGRPKSCQRSFGRGDANGPAAEESTQATLHATNSVKTGERPVKRVQTLTSITRIPGTGGTPLAKSNSVVAGVKRLASFFGGSAQQRNNAVVRHTDEAVRARRLVILDAAIRLGQRTPQLVRKLRPACVRLLAAEGGDDKVRDAAVRLLEESKTTEKVVVCVGWGADLRAYRVNRSRNQPVL